MSKFKTLSFNEMYKFYLAEKVKANSSLFINSKNELCYSSDREIEMLTNQVILAKEQYYELIEKDMKTSVDLNDISDFEVAIRNFEKRKNELLSDIKKVKKLIDVKVFKQILTVYNTKAGDRIIEGYKFDLLNGLGFLLGKRIERTFSTKAVNWGATNKLRDSKGELSIDPKTGKKKLIYFIGEDYLRVGWEKIKGIINFSIYGFEPAGGQLGKGYRQKFSKSNENNKLLRLNYRFCPRLENE